MMTSPNGRVERERVAQALTSSERVVTTRRLLERLQGNLDHLHKGLDPRSQSEKETSVSNRDQRVAEAAAQATTDERKRLARELHDSVSQELYGIAVVAHSARSMLEQDPARVADPLDYIHVLAEAAILELRAIIFRLRPDAVANDGLVAGITRQAASAGARYGIRVDLAMDEEPDLQLDAKEAAYRIAQEALNNAVKHAQASNILVRLTENGDGVLLEVADSGNGFDTRAPRNGHLGLHFMEERAAAVGGQLEVESEMGQGTRVRLWLPAQGS
jgi:signal transduction histidine kinase